MKHRTVSYTHLDVYKRQVEELSRIGVTHAIRIGSCGALQTNIHLGDLIMVQGTVRDEGTSKTYIELIYPAVPDYELLNA